MKSLSIQVIGKVQGVSFRYHTQEEAERLGLNGFVRNQYDGSVYIEIQGPEDDLNLFLQWCQEGPRFARVDDLQVETSDLPPFANFEIRY